MTLWLHGRKPEKSMEIILGTAKMRNELWLDLECLSLKLGVTIRPCRYGRREVGNIARSSSGVAPARV